MGKVIMEVFLTREILLQKELLSLASCKTALQEGAGEESFPRGAEMFEERE